MTAPLPLVLRDTVTEADIEQVKRIVVSTGFFAEYEIDIAVELVEERLAKGEKSGYFFVFADRNGKTLGYSCYGPIACTENRFDLYWIAVDKEYQNEGVGKILLRGSEERIAALKGEKVYVETSSREEYLPTRSFYLRCGYRVDAEQKDFYKKGDNKVVLVKDVSV